MTRTIVGTLFVETLWARIGAAERRAHGRHAPPPLDPRYMPPEDVLERLGALATLLRAFADEGDVLWTPRPVAPERVADVPGVPRPLLVSGPRPTPGDGDLAWGDATPAAAAGNDRRLALRVQRQLGCALPSACAIEAEDDLDAAVAAAAAASVGGRWIAKATHSSAGRGRVGGTGPGLDDARRAAVEKLLELHGALVIEPWMARTADFGAVGFVGAGGALTHVAVHALENTLRGDFRGIAFPPANLREDEEVALRGALAAAATALDACGYRGPVGIDAFRHRDRQSVERFHPMCEINARLTFGRVARTLAERIAAATGLSADGPWSFRVGDAAEVALVTAATPAERLFVLLRAGPPDGVAAWITHG
jgi:hypothetical protein